MTGEALDAVVRRARSVTPAGATVLVGVDGPSGAGKSTFARAVGEALGAPVIAVDDFLSWNEYDLWWPYFVESVLERLAAGLDARFHPRDWTGDEFGDALLLAERVVPRAPVVVVEGVTGTRDDGRPDPWSVRVWVEAPEADRLQRGVERDGEDHRPLWIEAARREAAFFGADRTRERAHVVVDGTTGGLLIER